MNYRSWTIPLSIGAFSGNEVGHLAADVEDSDVGNCYTGVLRLFARPASEKRALAFENALILVGPGGLGGAGVVDEVGRAGAGFATQPGSTTFHPLATAVRMADLADSSVTQAAASYFRGIAEPRLQ